MAKLAFFTLYDTFCYGLRIISSYLEANGHETSITFFKEECFEEIRYSKESPVNFEITQRGKLIGSHYDVNPWTKTEEELLLNHLDNLSPDIIGLSSRSFLDKYNRELLDKIKKRVPNAILVCGGYGPSFKPELYAEVCDGVVMGEGEAAIFEIAEASDKNKPITQIQNVAYTKNGIFIKNSLRSLDGNIDKYPLPKIDDGDIYLIERNRVSNTDPRPKNGYYPLLAGRGCVGSCSYCSAGQWHLLYKDDNKKTVKRRNRSVDSVMEELKYAKTNGSGGVYIFDSYFVGSASFMEEFFTRYKKDINLPFEALLKIEQMNSHPELFEMAVDAGLRKVIVGIQSGSEKFSREVYNRNATNADILKFSNKAHDHNLAMDYHFILGNPLETEENYEASLDLIAGLPKDIIRDSVSCHRLSVFPGTPLALRLEKTTHPLPQEFEYAYMAMLFQMRFVMDTDDFEAIRSVRLFKQDPQFMSTIYMHRYISEMVRREITCFDMDIMRDTYKGYLNDYHGKDIFIWGTGSGYTALKDIFSNHHIVSFIDNDRSKLGQDIDGIPIAGPDILKKFEKAPVFICSAFKREILDQVKQNYPGMIVP